MVLVQQPWADILVSQYLWKSSVLVGSWIIHLNLTNPMAHEGIWTNYIGHFHHTAFSLLATEILHVGCQDTLRHPWLHQEIDVNSRLRWQSGWHSINKGSYIPQTKHLGLYILSPRYIHWGRKINVCTLKQSSRLWFLVAWCCNFSADFHSWIHFASGFPIPSIG